MFYLVLVWKQPTKSDNEKERKASDGKCISVFEFLMRSIFLILCVIADDTIVYYYIYALFVNYVSVAADIWDASWLARIFTHKVQCVQLHHFVIKLSLTKSNTRYYTFNWLFICHLCIFVIAIKHARLYLTLILYKLPLGTVWTAYFKRLA